MSVYINIASILTPKFRDEFYLKSEAGSIVGWDGKFLKTKQLVPVMHKIKDPETGKMKMVESGEMEEKFVSIDYTYTNSQIARFRSRKHARSWMQRMHLMYKVTIECERRLHFPKPKLAPCPATDYIFDHIIASRTKRRAWLKLNVMQEGGAHRAELNRVHQIAA